MEILRSILSMVLLIIGSTAYGQISFYKVYSGNGYDRAEGIAELPDSSYIVTGSSSSFEEAPSQAFLLKLDKYGVHQWAKHYGGTEFEEGRRVFHVPSYGYYLVGTSSSNGHAFDAYVVFTDLSGNLIWENWYDNNGAWERVHDALLLGDTSLVLIGETSNNQEQEPDHYLIRIDKLGNELWSQQLGSLGVDFLQKGVIQSDTTFAVVGTVYNQDSLQNKGYVALYNNSGELIWEQQFGMNGNYQLNDVHIIGGNLWVAGQKISGGMDDSDEYFIRVDPTGNLISDYDYYASGNARTVAFTPYTAGTGDKYFVAVSSWGGGSYEGGEDFVIARYNAGYYWDGYGMGYNGVGQDQLNHLIGTNDGYAVAVGYHSDEGYSTGGSSLFIIKIGDENAFPASTVSTIYNILDIPEYSPTTDRLMVYPNPFQDRFDLLVSGELEELILTDLSGKVVYTEKKPNHSISTTHLSAGTYLVSCSINGIWQIQKIVKY